MLETILALVREGWEPVTSGSGDWLYLRRGEKLYRRAFSAADCGFRSFGRESGFWRMVDVATRLRRGHVMPTPAEVKETP
jgi:hypothetical protein